MGSAEHLGLRGWGLFKFGIGDRCVAVFFALFVEASIDQLF